MTLHYVHYRTLEGESAESAKSAEQIFRKIKIG